MCILGLRYCQPLMKISQGFPPVVVPLHQAISDRLVQLDLDASNLTKRYCEYLRSIGDTKAVPNNRRRQIAGLLCSTTDSSLKTIFSTISPMVLNGQFLLCTGEKQLPFANSVEMSGILKDRMDALGITAYELTRRYCLLKSPRKTSRLPPVTNNHLGVIAGLLDSTRNPRFSSLVNTALAFEDHLYIRWQSTQRTSMDSSSLGLIEMPAHTDVILEYPIFSYPLRVG